MLLVQTIWTAGTDYQDQANDAGQNECDWELMPTPDDMNELMKPLSKPKPAIPAAIPHSFQQDQPTS